LQSGVLIKCVPVEIIWKVKEHTIIDKQIVLLTKLIEIMLDEAQNAQIWMDMERTALMHMDQAETIKAETRGMEAPRAETKTELEKSEITQLMEDLMRVIQISLVAGTYEVKGDESDEEGESEEEISVEEEDVKRVEVLTSWDYLVVEPESGKVLHVKRPREDTENPHKKVVVTVEKENKVVEKQEGGGFGLDPKLKTILTKVSEMELRVKLGELVQISPMLRKGVLSLLKTKKTIGSKASVQKVHSMEVPVGCHEWKRLLYSTGIGLVNGTLEGWKIQFTLDDGSEVNLMSQVVVGELA
ncbi:hypothetical protein IWQ61_010700, partial [Dispira simplex]